MMIVVGYVAKITCIRGECFRPLYVFGPLVSEFVLDGDHKVGVRIVRLHLEEVRELVGDERRGRLESRVAEPLD